MEKKKLVLKEKLIGKNKKNCAVFISGRGSNLKSLINFSKNKSSPIKIVLVVSNNIKAKGLIYAKKNDIEYMIVNFSKTNKAESKILKKLKKKQNRSNLLGRIHENFIKKIYKNI